MQATVSSLCQRHAKDGLRLLPSALVLLFLVLMSGPRAWGQVYSWSTIAGTNYSGSADGTNSDARFNGPVALVVDGAGNIYVSDRYNNTMRKIVPVGTNWVVSTMAGSVGQSGSRDGTNSTALFNVLSGITVDSDGIVYVADWANNTIRKLAPVGTNWVVTTIAGRAGNPGGNDGINTAALFDTPNGMGIDSTGTLYVTTQGSALGYNTIRRMVRVGTNWVTQTIAGSRAVGSADGTNRSATFNFPSGAVPDNSGNVYVADQDNSTIRKLAPDGTNWVVSTIAGLALTIGHADGTNSDARFDYPGGLAVDNGDSIYVADYGNSLIRKIIPVGTNWVVSTIGGHFGGAQVLTNGIGSDARFALPNGVAVDSRGNVYVADQGHNAIRRGIPLPVCQAAALANDTLTLTWNAAVGQVLQMQYTTDVGQSNWISLGEQFVCTNSTIQVPDLVISGAQRYYRVLVTP